MMPYEGAELESLESAPNYYSWIVRSFSPFLAGRCLEVGAGSGTFTRFLLASPLDGTVAIEPSPSLFERLSQLASVSPALEVSMSDLDTFAGSGPAGFDCAVMVNVIEHIDDDSAALAKVRSLLKPSGHLCLFAPAMPALFGSLDREFCHHRRYSMRSLGELAARSGFEVARIRYMNMPGALSWWLMSRLLGVRRWPANGVKLYDTLLVPPIRLVESLIHPPFGQSILMVGRPA